MERRYLAIDLKSFYASVECADRGLDPLKANLVVADESRTDKTICLAVSPNLKSYGLPGRCRLFEAKAKARARGIDFIIAPPRMSRYLEVSAQVYSIYLRYVAPEDIYAYSVDEVFIDVTGYLRTYKMDAHELAVKMIREVLGETGITATCGIGTNLYLAKIAMDVMGKHVRADADGVRIAQLDEYSYRAQLWAHRPLTDFWRLGKGTAKKLEQHLIFTMGDIARASLGDQEWFYKTFGIDAEILIDHAWGIEPCTMEQIKNYQPASNSICEGQVLREPYPNELARGIVWEMADCLTYRLLERGVVTSQIVLDVGYDRENCDNGIYQGEKKIDRYGRAVPHPAHGSVNLPYATNLGSVITKAATDLFDKIADSSLSVRRVTITACDVEKDEGTFQFDLFSDTQAMEKEKSLQEAALSIKQRYGKNAILRGANFLEGATMRERNGQIGGHKA